MRHENPTIYEFGPFRLDASKRLLFRDGELVTVTPKLFETLRALVERAGEPLSKDDLMQEVWGETIVEETNLTSNVSNLRKLLGEKKNEHQYILTIPGEGYRFVAPVTTVSSDTVGVVVRESVRTKLTVQETSELRPGINRSRLIIVVALATLLIIISSYFLFGRRTTPTAVGTRSFKSIAVLPFKPLVPGDRDDSLEMGITDDLITRLNRLRGLEVRQIGAVRRYAGLEQDALSAGRQQKVDVVLDGSIQRAGDRIRVNARLMNVATGAQIWAGKFDQKYNDIFAVQDSISSQLAESIINLTLREKQLISMHYTESVEANRLYHLGRFHWNKRSSESLMKAIEYFNQAIEKDPTYALAYSALADTYIVLPSYTGASIEDTHEKAKGYSLKAIDLDSELPEPYVTLASIESDYWRWEEAGKKFKQALELNPNYSTAYQWYGEYLTHIGRVEEARSAFQRALELDPTSLAINELFAESLYQTRRYDEAIDQCQRTLELDQNFEPAHKTLGMIYQQKAMHEESKSAFQKALDLSGGASRYLAFLGTAHAKSGNMKEAESVLEKLKKMLIEKRATSSEMAVIYTGMRNTSRAFEWLEKAYADRSPAVLYLADPFYDDLRSHDLFKDLERRVRGKHEAVIGVEP